MNNQLLSRRFLMHCHSSFKSTLRLSTTANQSYKDHFRVTKKTEKAFTAHICINKTAICYIVRIIFRKRYPTDYTETHRGRISNDRLRIRKIYQVNVSPGI